MYNFMEGGIGMYNIKGRLADLGKSQVWLLKELRVRGFNIQPPQLCNIINGVYTYPKARDVLDASLKIISDAESLVTQ